jgi:hypothetical protein
MAGNLVKEIAVGSQNPIEFAEDLILDTTPPTVSAFTLNMETSRVTILFDEPIQIDKVNPQNLIITNRPVDPSATYRLDNTNNNDLITTVDGRTAEFKLSDVDSTNLKALFDLAVSANRTFISGTNLAKDIADNEGDAENFQATEFKPDTTAPELAVFEAYNANNGIFRLLFTEPVKLTSLDTTTITFQLSTYSNTSAHTLDLDAESVEYVGTVKSGLEIKIAAADWRSSRICTPPVLPHLRQKHTCSSSQELSLMAPTFCLLYLLQCVSIFLAFGQTSTPRTSRVSN